MHKVGINGGGLLVEIGDASAMSVFFDLVTEHAFQLDEPAIALVCDRLYRRYVRREDAEATLEALRSIRDVFSSVPATTLEERIANEKKDGSGILFTETNLAGAFSKYFSAIDRCIESAEYAFQYFEEGRKLEYSYEPVMVIRSELPGFMLDKRIPLSAYDELGGDPFWLKPRENRSCRG